MKIWFISDTHGFHKKIDVPKCDIVIHCGDESNNRNARLNLVEAVDFFDWYSSLPIKHKIFVPGNHSLAIFHKLLQPDQYKNITFLIHDLVTIENIRIFGSPYTPSYGVSWAFMKARQNMHQVWENIPACEILVTHGPPKGVLDLTEDKETRKIVQVGCNSLRKKVFELKPFFHAFGHIHEEKNCYNYGVLRRPDTAFINCSYLINHPTGPKIQEKLILVDYDSERVR